MNSLLCSPWLRRVGARPRVEHPGWCARLNRVRKKLATGTSRLDLYQHVALERFSTFAPVAGARVLEIGSDLEGRVLSELQRLGAAEAIGVNSSDELWGTQNERGIVVNDRARLVQGDARRLQFDDGAFDAVFSVATFEHILDLPAALGEMARVLKPGGLVYSNFGPIWSAGKGHHVYAVGGEEEARHFKPETNPLPDFCHLLVSPAELRAAQVGRTSAVRVDPIVAWTYGATGINRLFYSDYVRIFHAAPFALLSLREECDPVDPQLRRLLGFRYPDEARFDVTNIEIVLRKSEA